MRKALLFCSLIIALITMLLSATACTKKVEQPTVANEELTVYIGSVTATGDTTIYLQTVVKPRH
jgi:hypothetical protein